MQMSKMEFNGVELELDLMDADVMEKFEENLKKIAKNVQKKTQYEGKSNADCLRIQCKHVKEFFDTMFGSGTSDRLFGGKNNLAACMEAFGIAASLAEQENKRTREIMGRYSPARVQNRAERRAGNIKKRGKNNKIAAYNR